MDGLKLIQSQVVIVQAKLEAESYKSYSSKHRFIKHTSTAWW